MIKFAYMLLCAAVLSYNTVFAAQVYTLPEQANQLDIPVKLAQSGLVEAQVKVGRDYLDGKGAPKNPSQASAWYLKAAEPGDAASQNSPTAEKIAAAEINTEPETEKEQPAAELQAEAEIEPAAAEITKEIKTESLLKRQPHPGDEKEATLIPGDKLFALEAQEREYLLEEYNLDIPKENAADAYACDEARKWYNEASTISLIAIAIMIGTLVVAYAKKIMMTYALIIANLVVFFLSTIFHQELIGELGFRPIYLSLEYSPQIYTLFTAMFLHADPLHLIGNMLVFFFMGIAFEARIGWKRFLVIYLVTGVIGSLTHAVLNLDPSVSAIPLVGASGAIFGILGAFAYAYPWDEVVMPIPIGIMFIMKVKVLYAAIIFSVMETVFVFLGAGQSNTAHFAHFGGLIGGVVVAVIILGRKRETVNARGQHVYTDPNSPYAGRQREIDYSALKKLAVTEKLRDELERIKAENVPQVRDIWLNHFLTQTTCPKCGKLLKSHGNKVSCENNHFSLKY